MTWFSLFVRIPTLAVATPVAIVAAILISAMYGYRLEIDAIGLRFDKDPAVVQVGTATGISPNP